MKKIYIQYQEPITEERAVRLVESALRTGQRTGLVTFADGCAVEFSGRAKNLSMTVFYFAHKKK